MVSCGGSGVAGSLPKVSVQWPAQTKSIQAPSNAQSAEIQFLYGTGNSSQWYVDRPSGTGAQLIAYTGSSNLPAGPAVLMVTFFSGTGGSGTVVATSDVSVKIGSDGTVLDSAGNPLGNVTYQSNLSGLSLSVPSIAIGQTQSILVTGVYGGNIVALPQGLVTLQVADNGQLATLNSNSLTGVAEGTMHLTATFESFNQTLPVVITPKQSAPTKVNFPANQIVWDSVHGKIWGTFGPSSQYPNSIVDLDPTTGTIGTPISVGSSPSQISVAADGSVAYVGVDGAGSVVKVNLVTRSTGSIIQLPQSFAGPMVATSIDVNPTNTDEIAVCAHDKGDSGFEGPFVFRSGSMVGTAPSVYTATHALYTSGTSIIGINDGLEPGSVYSINVTANSVDFVKTTPTGGQAFLGISQRGGLAVFGGLVFDEASLTQSGQLSFANENLVYSATDLNSNSAFAVMTQTFPPSKTVRIRSFDLGTYAPTAAVDLLGTSGQENVQQLLRYGTKGIAVLTDKATYLLPGAPGL